MASKISSFLRGLVGSGGEEEAGETPEEAVEYNGYLIRPTPRKQGGQWLTAGIIVKQAGETAQEHPFIRAETHASRDQASDFAIVKGKQIIDEQGDRIFRES
jgi:hypothetical protein